VRGSDGRVRKEYLGNGDRARQAAREDAEARAAKQTELAAIAAATTRSASTLALTDDLVELSTRLMEATLIATGYCRRNYGPWRKQRDVKARR
jgi:hypothetical protein